MRAEGDGVTGGVDACVPTAPGEIFGLLAPALTALRVRKQDVCLELVAGAIHNAASSLRRNSKRPSSIITSTVAFVVGASLRWPKMIPPSAVDEAKLSLPGDLAATAR